LVSAILIMLVRPPKKPASGNGPVKKD